MNIGTWSQNTIIFVFCLSDDNEIMKREKCYNTRENVFTDKKVICENYVKTVSVVCEFCDYKLCLYTCIYEFTLNIRVYVYNTTYTRSVVVGNPALLQQLKYSSTGIRPNQFRHIHALDYSQSEFAWDEIKSVTT